MFSDVNPLLRTLKTEAGEEEHLRKMIWVERIFTDRHHYQQSVFNVLPQLRRSVMHTIAHAEKVSLLKMFSIHIVDVLCSIIAALLAVRILKHFEGATTPGSPQVWELVQQSVLIALGVFGLNILASSLHAQKIEREMLVVFRVQTTLTRWLSTFVLNMSRQAKSRFPTGDIVNVAQTDARHVAEFFAHAAVDFPVLFVSVTLIVAIMWTIVGPAAFVALGILLLQIPVSLFFSWLGQRLHGELMRRSDRRLSLVTEWVQAARLMRYFGWTKHMAEDIRAAAQREFRQDLKMKAHYSTSFGLSTSWWMLVALGVFAGFLWFHLEKSASQVFAAIWLSSILGQQLNPLPWFVRIFSEARVGSQRLETIFVAPLQTEEFAPRGFVVGDEVAAQIDTAREFRNISFELRDVWVQWPGITTPALQGVTCRFPAGHLSAIVGPVGAGKSVLLQTIMGEITPSRGEVLLECDAVAPDGQIKKIKFPVHCEKGLAALRRLQTFVPQEAFVAAASVRENVPLTYLNDREISADFDSEIVRALERAQLSTDVQTLPEGLSTELGERGVNLSGGQKQRLSLARAIHAGRPLVFLDDPMSAVDTETEERLVRELFEGCWRSSATIIWATHRLAHLALARHIIVLDGGKVIEQGGWQSLSQAGTRLHGILSSLKQNSLQKKTPQGDEIS
ncbi:MAG: hypothetical protein RI932_311 [Pseudomonadota bacterium]|jgi:ABC-type multidrug transport system fused ATPase/permease subunit